jgi:peptidoglycan/LPS O-acetylase OafA/YrhL
MLQRVQTIWLLLAALCAFLTLKFSFYSGSTLLSPHVELNGQHNIPLLILTVITGTIAAVCIFLFKNRKLQQRLCLVGLLLQLGCLAIYFTKIKEFTQGNFALWSVLSFAVVIFYIMAIAGINKDQKLVKSLDRLR